MRIIMLIIGITASIAGIIGKLDTLILIGHIWLAGSIIVGTINRRNYEL